MSQMTEAPALEVTPTPVETQGSKAGDDKELNAAVAKAMENMFAVNANAWAPRMVVKFKIECPSGQTALVKHLDTLALLEFDLVEELDFFTRKLFPANVDAAGNIEEAKAQAEENIWGALKDPEKRRRFLDMTGKLMAAASVDPIIVHDGVAVKTEGNGKKRTVFGYELSSQEQIEIWGKPVEALPVGNAVYSGYVDFADRMTFFQELNKPLGLIEPFREEQAAVLQDMARSEGHGPETESAVGD